MRFLKSVGLACTPEAKSALLMSARKEVHRVLREAYKAAEGSVGTVMGGAGDMVGEDEIAPCMIYAILRYAKSFLCVYDLLMCSCTTYMCIHTY